VYCVPSNVGWKVKGPTEGGTAIGFNPSGFVGTKVEGTCELTGAPAGVNG